MVGTVLLVSWLATYKRKRIIENCTGAHKVGKIVTFWPNFDPNFTDIWRA